MQSQAKLSQHTAILLERARRAGISDDVLLECSASGNTAPLQAAEAEHYHYDEFISYAQSHGESLEQAIREGYRMTFNTFRGLQVWLKEKFGVEEGQDFTASEGRLLGLKLAAAETESLRNTLAANWIIQDAAGAEDGRINLIVRGLE